MRAKMRAAAAILALLLAVGLFAGCDNDKDSSQNASSSPPMAAGVPDVLPGSTPTPQSTQTAPPSSSAPGADSQASSSSTPEKQPAPVFLENGIAASANGTTVTVTFKTDVSATVNAILSTSSASIGVSTFYDYYNRGAALEGAIGKYATYKAGPNGSSITIELPAADKNYYLLVNAVENETGTWQSSVTVVSLFDAGAYAPVYTGEIEQKEDKDQSLTFAVNTNMPVTVYCIVTAADATAPTPQQVRNSGSGYTGALAVGAGASNRDAAPYQTMVYVPKQNLAAGSYVAWFVAEGTVDGKQVLGASVGKAVFSI